MTREEAIKELRQFSGTTRLRLSANFWEALNRAIKLLEQESSDDVMAIHTQGLDEDIRCAMCTNSMKSDSGCDGGCIVNEGMYKKVMETINNHIFSQPTSEDCVSREQALKELKESAEHHANDSREEVLLRRDRDIIRALPSVTPTRKKGKWVNKSHTSDCGIKFVASECTCCGKKTFFDCDQLVYNYCPNCGAEMESEE